MMEYHMQLTKDQLIRELTGFLKKKRFFHDIVETCVWERPYTVLVYTRITRAEEQRRLWRDRRMERHE